MDLKQRLGEILRALDITEIQYSLSGGGDSGETELERVEMRGDPGKHDLPDIPIFITDTGHAQELPDLLSGIVAEAPDGDWVNNEGGYGTVYIRPFDDEDDLAIECDMTYREDGDWGNDEDDEDDEEFIDDGLTDDDAPVPLTVVGELAP